MSDGVAGRHAGISRVTVEGVVDHTDGTVEVPVADRLPAAAHPGTSRTWLTGIEALRGVAAMAVVVHHSWALSKDPADLRGPQLPLHQFVAGLGLWGVLLFFMLSGYLLSDTFWRAERADLRVYAVRRFFRIAPAYYVNVAILFLFFASAQVTFSSTGRTQVLANLTFTQNLFPGTVSNLNVNGALWTLTVEMMLYLCLPVMAYLVRLQPWLATAGLILLGLGWRGWVAFGGDGLRHFYFGDGDLPLTIQSLFIGQQFVGALAIFALGILARWLVVHGRLDGLYRRLPARLGVSSFLLLTLPSVALLFWVTDGTDYRNPLLFTTYEFVLMLVLLPALLLAARPADFAATPLRSVSRWLGERSYSIYLWHFPIILAVYERGPLALPAPADGYAWRLPLVLLLTLVVATVSYRLIERPGMEYGRTLAQRLARGRRVPTPIKEPAP